MYRYSPQELKCLPVNTVLERVQVELQSKMPISSNTSITTSSASITTSSVPVTVSNIIRSSNGNNPSSSVCKLPQETDSITSKVIIHLKEFIYSFLTEMFNYIVTT